MSLRLSQQLAQDHTVKFTRRSSSPKPKQGSGTVKPQAGKTAAVAAQSPDMGWTGGLQLLPSFDPDNLSKATAGMLRPLPHSLLPTTSLKKETG